MHHHHHHWNGYNKRCFLGHHWLSKEKRPLHWKLVRVTKYDKPPTCQVSIHSINNISVIDVLSFCPTILQHYAWHKRSIIMTSRVMEECKLRTSFGLYQNFVSEKKAIYWRLSIISWYFYIWYLCVEKSDTSS